MRTYQRVRIDGACYFFTVNLAEREGNNLLIQHIEPLREAFRQTRQDHPFLIDAIVILPEHLHCIWQLPPEDSDYSTRWLLIKARFSMATPKSEYANPNSVSGSDDTGCMPFATKQDYRNHVDYIHYNPGKHGHAKATKEWPHSSFHCWVRQGSYRR